MSRASRCAPSRAVALSTSMNLGMNARSLVVQ
jgi:hypothetical protein